MASDAKKPPKGILKKTARATPPPHTGDEEARQIALRHAAIIQDRKTFDNTVVDSILRLIDLPRVWDAPYDPAKPAPSDATEFKALVRTFQPSDYDDLIEERNIEGRCGYTLCGRPRKKFEGNGTWKLVNTGRKDFGIVQKKELEKWCSQECARRALYVKVQLNETAAWERAGIPDIGIELFDEKQETTPESQLAREIGRLKLDEERRLAKDSATLSLERGDTGETLLSRLADLQIKENAVTKTPSEPTPDQPQG